MLNLCGKILSHNLRDKVPVEKIASWKQDSWNATVEEGGVPGWLAKKIILLLLAENFDILMCSKCYIKKKCIKQAVVCFKNEKKGGKIFIFKILFIFVLLTHVLKQKEKLGAKININYLNEWQSRQPILLICISLSQKLFFPCPSSL